jgi:hypothetical protein
MVPRDVCRYRAAQTHQVARREFELQTSPSARDEDRPVLERGRVDDDREGPARRERADPADDVSRGAFGHGRLGHDRPVPSGGGREQLQGELPIDWHDGQERGPVDQRDERLEDTLGLDAEGRGGLDPVIRAVVARSAVSLGKRVRVDAMDDPGPGDDIERAGRCCGHGPIVSISAMLEAAYQPSASIDAR